MAITECKGTVLKILNISHSNGNAEVAVELQFGYFDAFKRRVVKNLSQTIRVPGFRPGKAPNSVIVKQYGEDNVIREAADLFLEEAHLEILNLTGLSPSGAGSVTSISASDDSLILKVSFPQKLEDSNLTLEISEDP